ncbi:unnamed protein product [Microthlaspi erraticum]|uniref:Uncharacterized protein n=1 Tax=Microthlaspi erraticum TaxID=1685480 RepID=A0A6D2IG57_9BRAS|nr:unnamed protein product [Microthlaspi erraticum]
MHSGTGIITCIFSRPIDLRTTKTDFPLIFSSQILHLELKNPSAPSRFTGTFDNGVTWSLQASQATFASSRQSSNFGPGKALVRKSAGFLLVCILYNLTVPSATISLMK